MSEKENVLDVYYLHVVSDVQSRFATTEIISRVANHSGNAKEAHFVANLPNAAFITYFEMEVDGKVIVGEVKEKEKAKQVYEAAKFRGETAGHVAQQVRETSKFEISVNIKGGEEGKFKLVYQELLQRVRGVYKHQINIQPGQIVKDLQVDVHVSESLPFRVFHVPKFAGKLDGKSNKELLDYYKASDDVSIHMSSDKNHHRASVHWRPSEEKQREVCESGVLDGQLAILYDVDREEDTGQLQVVNGYFIHYFAPSKLEVGNKDIIFALDISGSMSGMKLQQTKEAMDLILSQLKEDDSFNIIAFDNETNFWKTSSMKASESNVADAKSWINNLHARGGTDIDSAVQEGIKQLVSGFKKTENALDQLIIILTDGQHNSGGLSRNDIGSHAVKVMKEKNKNVKVFGLAFGEYADFDLLKEIASKTGAVARKIYQDSDASLQLKNFYEEISSPLLANLKIRYLDPNIDPDSIVCNSSGDTYYDGSEMIYTGKLSDITNGSMTFETEIEGRGANGQFQRNDHLSLTAAFPDLVPPVPVADLVDCGRPEETGKVLQSVGDIVERSWAYLTIKSLLDKADSEQNSSELENMKKKALELSLKYHFVTGVTSMVAVQPSDGSSDSSHELSDKIRSLQTSTDDSCVCHVEPRLQTRRRPEDPLKRREMTLASDSYSDEVVGIMQMNLEKVLERDARLSQLDDRADALFATAASKERRKPWTSLFNSVSNLWPFGNTAAHGHPKEFISANTVQSSFLAPASATAPCKTEETKNVINKFLQGTKQEIDAEFTKITGNTDAQGTLFDFVKGNLISLLEILGKLLENSDTKNFTGNRIKEAIKKLKNGWEMTDLDVLICIIVAAQFSDDFMDEIFSSILVLSDGITLIPGSYPFIPFKDEKTLSVQRSDGNGQVRFDVPSGSIFDGLEVIFKLTKICHSSTPDGALALFKLLFETKADATGSPPEFNEKLFLEIMKKFHEK